jgi:hypothetical protein
VQSFWWGKAADGKGIRMVDVLNEMRAAPPDWQLAVSTFRRAMTRVNALSSERQVVAQAITRLPASEQECQNAEAARQDASVRHAELQSGQPALDELVRNAETRWQSAETALAAHRRDQPGLLISLSTWFRAGREWHAAHTVICTRPSSRRPGS